MTNTVTDEQLAAYLREELPLAELTRVEKALREQEPLRKRAAALALRRDLPYHSVGAIWRANRLSCPERSELGAYLLGTLDDGRTGFIEFHLESFGCRYCAANLADLRAASKTAPPTAERRRRYYESSAGHLRRND